MATATLVGGFTYGTFEILSISPASGSTAGGEPITINGTTLNEGCVIYIGDSLLVNQTYVDSVSITGETPPNFPGTYDVRAYQDGELSTLPAAFTYSDALAVTRLVPNNGTEDGGTAVSVYGSGFNALTTIEIGSAPLVDLVLVNQGFITGTTPAGTVGYANVYAFDGSAADMLANGYRYTKQLDIFTVSPATGYVSGGQEITISGTGFESWGPGDTLTIGGAECADVVLVDAYTLTAKTPAGTVGAATVALTASYGSASLIDGFTYIANLSISSITPAVGYVSGGQAVVITGTSFDSTAAVTIGGNPVTGLSVPSSTSILAVTPPGLVGPRDVVVTIGAYFATLTGGYTYQINPKDPIGLKAINDSFQDLLKVTGGLTSSLKTVLDASGKASAMQVSVNEVKITKLIIGE